MRKMLPLSIFVLAIASTMSAQVTFTFSTVDVPGSIFTRAHNINHQGDIVGLFAIVRGTGHGFLLHNGQFKQIDYPGSTFTSARGINGSRQIVGGYADVNNVDHGFLLQAGQFTSFDFPGAASTDAFDINDAGDIAGVYVDTSGVQHGFLLAAGNFSPVNFPGAAETDVNGISNVDAKRIEQETWSRDINSPLNMRPSLALRFSMEINRQLNFEVMAPHSRRGTP